MDESVLSKLFFHFSSAVNVVKGHDDVHIFSHHDADGISAAIILAKTMMRAGKRFRVTLLPALNDETIETVMNCGAGCMIMADMGVSYIDALEKADADVVVLDHHKGDPAAKRVRYINPHSFGMDGMTAGCGASLSMMFSVQYDKGNWDLVQVAFAGIVGDKQHQKGLSGINEYLFREGSKRGYISETGGGLIPPGPLMSSLFISSDPYIRGVSGNADGVTGLLGDAGMDVTFSSSDMSDAARRKLSSLIAAKLLAQGVTMETLEGAASVRYMLKDWNIDAERFASMLDSCGRTGAGGVGIGLGLGDRKCWSEATALDEETRKKILDAAIMLDSDKLKKMRNIQFFGRDESGFTGMLCEIAMRYIGDPDKPTIGYNTSDDKIKASARCSHRLLSKGVDLSAAMNSAGKAAGGGGGGHRIAAGAWFPAGNENVFLDEVDRIIGEQVSAR
ncbi:MAG: DHH family phosphoesterase [Methanomassiliicoccaceae archaeon]|jgi:RecJ-like exonuclease|nr:DHH family phosphoesterase [Methanomassiliicoccaceae archaeon]